MRKFFLLLLLFLCAWPASADVRRTFPADGGVVVQRQPWALANEVYVFRPQVPQISLYLFFANLNPTSAQSATVRIYQTPDPTVVDWTNNQGLWVQDSITGSACSASPVENCVLSVPAGSMRAIYVTTMFARQIAVRITGGASAAGSPDQVSIFLVTAIGEPKGEGPGAGGVNILSGPTGVSSLRSQGTAADGAAAVGNPVQVGGVDTAGNAQRLLVNASGVAASVNQTTGVDTYGNTLLGLLVDDSGASAMLGMASFVFDGANWRRQLACTSRANITLSGSGSTQIVAASGATRIRVCHISISFASAVNFKLVEGTGANCATGPADITGLYNQIDSIALDFGSSSPLRSSASQALCANQSAAVAAGGVIVYAQY